MVFDYRTFDVETKREVDPSRLSIPEQEETEQEESFGFWIGNTEYCDLRGISWNHARRVAQIEAECINNIEESEDQGESGSCTIEEAAEFTWDLEDLLSEIGAFAGVDVGVASTVAALSATGCVPLMSCSAGAFGGWHAEEYPLVDFCTRRETVPLLMICAEKADVGLRNAISQGYAYNPLVVYADDIRKMLDFGHALWERSDGSHDL